MAEDVSKCHVCGDEYPSAAVLYWHYRCHHLHPPPVYQASTVVREDDFQQDRSQSMSTRCTLCSFNCSAPSRYRRHVKSHLQRGCLQSA
ncbi:uncharacterized protein [Apostichopus japonicus]|uniref:uncharacterized protein isoform X2 n=1 Tax=Stichopus japonicus TaxID=307972 RepID=UPI003AB7FCE8